MQDPFKIAATFFIALLITFLVLPRLMHIASHIGLIDHPLKRKAHKEPKPLIGGIGMMIGISISMLLFVPLQHLRGFYAGLLLLALTGFLDDFRELGPRRKFTAQILAAIFMVYFSNLTLHYFGDLLAFGPIYFDRSAILLTIFSTVGVINAINMIDGVDGLAGGISLVAFSSFALLAYHCGRPELLLLSIAFCGALIAFLRYNWHPATMFMGDAGSLTLGFAITFIAISLTQHNQSLTPPVAPLMIIAVPIVDTLTIMIKRMMKGRSPFHADRAHLHHILLRSGLTPGQTSAVMITASAFFASLGIIGTIYNLPEYWLFYLFIFYFILYFISSFYVKEMFRYMKKLKNKKKL